YRGPSGAEKAIKTALLATIEEPASMVRQLELERLDALQKSLWGKALAGDMPALDRILRIMERRSGLLGLDAPARLGVASNTRVALGGRGLSDLSNEQLLKIAQLEVVSVLPSP